MNPTNMVSTTSDQGLEDDRDSDGTMASIAGADKSVETFTIENVLDNPIGEDGIEDQELIDAFPTNVVKNSPTIKLIKPLTSVSSAAILATCQKCHKGKCSQLLLPTMVQTHTVPDPTLTPEIPLIYLGPGVDTDVWMVNLRQWLTVTTTMAPTMKMASGY